MSVKIRLRRVGRRNSPFFRVVVTDSRSAVSGRFLENVGWYDPNKQGGASLLKMERIDHWIGKGALLSDTVNNLVKSTRQGKPGRATASGSASVEAPPAPAAEAAAPEPEAETAAAEPEPEPAPAEDAEPEAGDDGAKA